MPKDTSKSKTNKTAHVLNLLTDTDTVPEGNDASPAQEKSTPADRADDSHVEAQIRDALEQDLMSEKIKSESAAPAPEVAPAPTPEIAPTPTPEVAPAPTPEVAPTPTPEVAPTPTPEVAPTPTPEVAPTPTPEVAPTPTPEVAPTPTPEVAPAPEPAQVPVANAPLIPPATIHPPTLTGISYMNVMQALVEEKVDKYIKLFGLCTCARCKIDVMALTLTNLPAKYVVVRENEAIPMLSVYEGRYNAAVISQVMWACKKVLDNPRHEKK